MTGPQIYVDADACPQVVKDILLRAAERTAAPSAGLSASSPAVRQVIAAMTAAEDAYGEGAEAFARTEPRGKPGPSPESKRFSDTSHAVMTAQQRGSRR